MIRVSFSVTWKIQRVGHAACFRKSRARYPPSNLGLGQKRNHSAAASCQKYMSTANVDIDAYRKRLAERKSFFGGTVSTRLEAASPNWNALAVQPPALDPKKGLQRGKHAGGRSAMGLGRGAAARQGAAGGAASGEGGGAAAPKRDGGEAKRKRQAQLDDYSALQAGTAPAPKLLVSHPNPVRKSQPSSARPGVGGASSQRHSLSPAAQKWLERKTPVPQTAAAGRTAIAAQDRQRPLQAAAAKRQASQGGRKAAQNRAAATMPGKHGLSQAQRAATALQSAVDSSRRTGSLGSTGLPAAGSRGPLSATLASRGAKPQQLLRQTAGPHPGQAGRLGNGSGAHQGAQRAAAGNSAIQRSGGSLQHTRSRYDSDLEDEVEEDDEEGGPVEDWRAELQKITGYDPSRYHDEPLDDRRMEAGWREVQTEERRSTKLGAADDAREEAAEVARQAAKSAALRKRKL